MQGAPLQLRGPKPKDTDFEPQTLGERLRWRRLILKLNKRQAADRLGVTGATIRNWEVGRTRPSTEYFPAIAELLGYVPLPNPETIPERLRAWRIARGLSIRAAARSLRVDAGTWQGWEKGGVILHRAHRALVARLLGVVEAQLNETMIASWNRLHGEEAGPDLHRSSRPGVA